MQRRKIFAIHDKDLDPFLDGLGLLEAFQNGQLKCAICGSVINRENFRCVYPENDDIKFCCSTLQCYNEVVKKMEEMKP